MSSPVVIDGHIYLHGRNQHLHCLDAGTGKVAWKSKEKFGKYWSMIANGNRILALDQRGELIYFEASPKEFKLIGRRKVSAQRRNGGKPDPTSRAVDQQHFTGLQTTTLEAVIRRGVVRAKPGRCGKIDRVG